MFALEAWPNMTWDYSVGDVVTIVMIFLVVYFHYSRVVLRMDKMEKKLETDFSEVAAEIKLLESRATTLENQRADFVERVARIEEWKDEHSDRAGVRDATINSHSLNIATHGDRIKILDDRVSRWEEILMRREEEGRKHA